MALMHHSQQSWNNLQPYSAEHPSGASSSAMQLLTHKTPTPFTALAPNLGVTDSNPSAADLLGKLEGPICRLDPSHRDVCCLPGARVRDVARKLPGLVQPSDYYPLLVMQVSGHEIMERSPKAIKTDFRALGQLAEGSGAQVVFSSIPSVAGKSTERDRKTHLINRWLRGSCHR